MTSGARTTLLFAAAAIAGVLLLTASFDLPAFGASTSPYAHVMDRTAVVERKCANAVTSVVFDQRGTDTLGEGSILFCAVVGVIALLRAEPDERRVRADDHDPRRARSRPSDLVCAAGFPLVVVAMIAGLQLITHGEPTPGGGFQGGVLAAGALAALYACGSVPRYFAAAGEAHVVEALAVASFPALGVAAVVVGRAFLANFVPLGTISQLWSGGTMLFLNVGVGVAVAAGVAGALLAFLEQLRLRKR